MDITDDTLKAAIEKVIAARHVSGERDDALPTDRDVFFMIFPQILGGFAGKTANTRDAISTAFQMAREAVGQCCMMGVARPVTICSDQTMLAIRAHQFQVPGVQGAVAPGRDPTQSGVMVAQYPMNNQNGGVVAHNQPGAGSMVQQFPTAAAGPQGSPPPQQQSASNGLVTQFPTVQAGGGYQPGVPGTRPIVPGQTSNIQPTHMFPNDPSVHPYPTAPTAAPVPPQFQPLPPPGYR